MQVTSGDDSHKQSKESLQSWSSRVSKTSDSANKNITYSNSCTAMATCCAQGLTSLSISCHQLHLEHGHVLGMLYGAR